MIQINISQLYISRADETVPALEKIPAMQRRRLSPIAKLAINSAIGSLNAEAVDYIVWASQYGDEHKTLKILADVLQIKPHHLLNFRRLSIMPLLGCIQFYVRIPHPRPVWPRRGVKH